MYYQLQTTFQKSNQLRYLVTLKAIYYITYLQSNQLPPTLHCFRKVLFHFNDLVQEFKEFAKTYSFHHIASSPLQCLRHKVKGFTFNHTLAWCNALIRITPTHMHYTTHYTTLHYIPSSLQKGYLQDTQYYMQ